MRGIEAPRWMVLVTASIASMALLGVDRLINSDAHILLGFFVIVAGMTWTGRTFEAIILGTALIGGWTVLETAERAKPLSLVLLGLVSAAVLLTLGVLLMRTFRSLVLEMSAAARRDPLTGLLNTRAFQEVAERERRRAFRTGMPISIAFLDLDGFKQINDVHGHIVGDAVLTAYGEVIMSSVRATDVVGRVGGDEFTIILPETDQFEATAVLQRIRHRSAIRTDIPLATATTGYVTFTTPPASVEEMMHKADELMYKAKRRGEAGTLIGRVTGGAGNARKPAACSAFTIDMTDQPGDRVRSMSGK